MKRKGIPLIVTLVACLITCTVSYIQRVDFGTYLLRFVIVLAIFGTISIILAVVINMNFKDEEVKDGVEFGLAINTNEQESIIHEYYGLYTEDKILLAEVGSEDTVIILEKLK